MKSLPYTVQSPESEQSANETPAFRWTILLTSLAFIVAQLDVSIVNIALPQISAQFKVDISGLQWIIDGYTLAFAVLMLSAGSLSDIFGPKRLFQIGIFIFGLASVGCGFANSAQILIAARVLQGIGAATMIPSSLAILNQSFAHAPKERAKAIGLWTAAGSAAIAAGPILGGLIIELSDWRFVFFINAPVCVLGILLSLKLPKTHLLSLNKSFDFKGQVAWTLSITLIIAAFIESNSLGIKSPYIYGSLITGIFALFVFIYIEKRVNSPMLPLSLFRAPAFNSLLLLGGLLNGFYYGTIFILSLYLQNVLQYSPLQAGMAFLPLTAGFVVSNVVSGSIINRYGIRIPILIGLILFALGFSGLLLAGLHTPFWQLCMPFLFISLGMGLAVPSMTNGVLSSVDRSLSGTASAALNTTRQSAGAIGVAILGALAGNNADAIIHTIHLSIAAALLLSVIVGILCYKHLQRKLAD